jgi:hypothetical protein
VTPPETLVVSLALAAAALGCGGRETTAQRVTRLRSGYRIVPAGVAAGGAAGDAAAVAVEVLVTNTGREGLSTLTLLVHVEGPDGRERLTRRAPLDVSALLPGVTARRRVVVAGIGLRPGEAVLVELERAPAAGELVAYPEYAGDARRRPWRP